MKRFLCTKHIHKLKKEGKSILLSTDKCTFCKWENRPIRLKDLARELENIAMAIRDADIDPYYDPFGYTWSDPLQRTFIKYLKCIHKDYRNNCIKLIQDIFKEIK